jgi:protein-tyrosine phosphatase
MAPAPASLPSRPESRPLPPPRHLEQPYRVCLVCLGNICRSPMAEVILQAQLAAAGLDGKIIVDSAGTGGWHVGERMHSRARAQLARRGYDGEAHRARQFQAAWPLDLVLAMDSSNLKTLKASCETNRAGCSRLRLFGDVAGLNGAGIPDPYGGGPAEFARVLGLLESAMPRLVSQLAEVVAAQP